MDRGASRRFADINACPAFPGIAGTCTAGSPGAACPAPAALPAGCNCTNGVTTCGCQIQQPNVPTPAICSTICRGNGVPRYGDYNGLGCSPQLIAAAWAATVNVNGNPTPDNAINVNVRTIGTELRHHLGTAGSGNFIQRVDSPNSIPEFDLVFASRFGGINTLVHLVRSNHVPGVPWSKKLPLYYMVQDEAGRDEQPLGASIIQSHFPLQGQQKRKGALEAVVRVQASFVPHIPPQPRDQYLTFHTQSSSGTWSYQGSIKVGGEPISGVTGDPALIQSTRGDNGNFEMLVPQGDNLVHYVRDNDLPKSPWSAGRNCF